MNQFGVHSRCGLHTRAVTVFRDPLSEGFRHFVSSMPAPVASGWSGRRVGLAPTGKAPPSHGAGGLRTTVPEPPVLRAIDLNKPTQTIAPSAGLMDALYPVFPPNPKAGVDHPLPQCL